LPAFETEKDELGYLPATISKSLMTGLLKGKLGFKGVVISDALSMVGLATRHPIDDLPLLFLQAGGDMVLFPHQEGYEKVVNAVKDGSLEVERIKDAVRRILKLKENLHLFEADYFKDLKPMGNLKELALKLAQKSVTKIRDINNVLPVKLEKGSKILMVNLIKPFFPKELTGEDFAPLKNELEANGMVVTSIDNADYNHVNKIKGEYDLIMINSILSADNYDGGSLRIDWEIVMTFWDGYIMDHPKVVFTSFGDPYKIFDVPYVKTYLNAYSQYPETQIAVARAVLGLEPIVGKSPVEFKGYFDRQV
jgi:beta-N-acetylhexosaminidase